MATVKINCPTCVGTGLTGVVTETICPECKGVGTVSVDNTQSLATISAATQSAVVVTTPKQVAKSAIRNLDRGDR